MAIKRDRAVLRQVSTLFNVGVIRDLTDGQLLERFSTGQGEAAELAFAALVDRHGPMVLRVCHTRLSDPNDSCSFLMRTVISSLHGVFASGNVASDLRADTV